MIYRYIHRNPSKIFFFWNVPVFPRIRFPRVLRGSFVEGLESAKGTANLLPISPAVIRPSEVVYQFDLSEK